MTGAVRISTPFELIPLAEWMERGACVGMDTNKFYPPSETDTRSAYVTEAKAVCKPCPVRTECLEWALRYDEFGVWGGTTQTERERMRNPHRTRIFQSTVHSGAVDIAYQIKRDYTGKRGSIAELAHRFNLDRTLVSDIIHGRTWHFKKELGGTPYEELANTNTEPRRSIYKRHSE